MLTNLSLPPSETTEFWALEVKSGQPFELELDRDSKVVCLFVTKQVNKQPFALKSDPSNDNQPFALRPWLLCVCFSVGDVSGAFGVFDIFSLGSSSGLWLLPVLS